jgi:hypothetical protein
MAGPLNIVPRYLPRYGMAPEWTRAVRPLALAFSVVALTITVIFRADVEAQAGAYATGVLVLMSSAAVAVTLSVRRRGGRGPLLAFSLITLVFAYTTVANVFERPEGVKIASFFIAAIVTTSLISRVTRATELRVTALSSWPSTSQIPTHDVQLPQLHRPVALPAPVAGLGAPAGPGLDQPIADQGPTDAGQPGPVDAVTGNLVGEAALAPVGMVAAQLAQAALNRGRHLMGTGIGAMGAVGQGGKPAGPIAAQSAVDGLAADAVAVGHLDHREPVA